MTSSLRKVINHIFRPHVDPERVSRIYREFDVVRGYGRYHDICKSYFNRNIPPLGKTPLLVDGFERARSMTESEASRLLKKILHDHELVKVKKDTRNLEGFHIDDRELIKEMLSTILGDEVDQLLTAFFRSEYLVHWFTVTMTPRASEQKSVSFRWHCDKGPKNHIKVLVYLNPTQEHGGNTEFINLDDTAQVAENGYIFGWSKTRTSSVQKLSRIAGRDIKTHRKKLKAGECLIFQPANVLHRGISPTLGPRYVITLCLLPSPVPWQEAFECGAMTDLATDDKWHQHADTLLALFNLEAAAQDNSG